MKLLEVDEGERLVSLTRVDESDIPTEDPAEDEGGSTAEPDNESGEE